MDSRYEGLSQVPPEDAVALGELMDKLGGLAEMQHEGQVGLLDEIAEYVPVLLLPTGNAFTVYTVQTRNQQGIVFRALAGPTTPFGDVVFAFFPQAYSTFRLGERNYHSFEDGACVWKRAT